jgi:hypothetical protein
VAVLLFENDSTGLQEEFVVGEIEVLGQDPNPSAGGGSRCE